MCRSIANVGRSPNVRYGSAAAALDDLRGNGGQPDPRPTVGCASTCGGIPGPGLAGTPSPQPARPGPCGWRVAAPLELRRDGPVEAEPRVAARARGRPRGALA